ncbi:MAG: processing protein [Solirubrobacteraceae bacterium]|nr:processing protein [Solirubrobacteraceae bacterium]
MNGDAACAECLRRTWLIARLAAFIDRASAETRALGDLFVLGDEELIAGLVPDGARRDEIRSGYEAFAAASSRERAGAAGIRAVCRHHRDYPERLLQTRDPPAVLHCAGSIELPGLLSEPAVAVVGARRASAYGLEVARALGRGLGAAGVTVISGMALGIDSAAHAGALEGGGRTVAVLGGGADVPYPASKRRLHCQIIRHGCAISELPPGFRAWRWCFPARNRMIAALAQLVVVVEATERSGSLITARLARELGRDVAAVPGRVSSRLAAGTNALLRDGAHVLTGAQDALDLLFGVGARTVRPGPDPTTLEPRLKDVLGAVAEGRDTLADLARTSEEAAAAMAALGELELLGHVRRAAGGRYVPVA